MQHGQKKGKREKREKREKRGKGEKEKKRKEKGEKGEKREKGKKKKREGFPASLQGTPSLKKAATYSPALRCSTIGAPGLNFSVRDGKRCIHCTIITNKLIIYQI